MQAYKAMDLYDIGAPTMPLYFSFKVISKYWKLGSFKLSPSSPTANINPVFDKVMFVEVGLLWYYTVDVKLMIDLFMVWIAVLKKRAKKTEITIKETIPPETVE